MYGRCRLFHSSTTSPRTIAASWANETDVQYTLHNANKSKIGHSMQLAHNQRVEFKDSLYFSSLTSTIEKSARPKWARLIIIAGFASMRCAQALCENIPVLCMRTWRKPKIPENARKRPYFSLFSPFRGQSPTYALFT